jgi:hypothetical protein
MVDNVVIYAPTTLMYIEPKINFAQAIEVYKCFGARMFYSNKSPIDSLIMCIGYFYFEYANYFHYTSDILTTLEGLDQQKRKAMIKSCKIVCKANKPKIDTIDLAELDEDYDINYSIHRYISNMLGINSHSTESAIFDALRKAIGNKIIVQTSSYSTKLENTTLNEKVYNPTGSKQIVFICLNNTDKSEVEYGYLYTKEACSSNFKEYIQRQQSEVDFPIYLNTNQVDFLYK